MDRRLTHLGTDAQAATAGRSGDGVSGAVQRARAGSHCTATDTPGGSPTSEQSRRSGRSGFIPIYLAESITGLYEKECAKPHARSVPSTASRWRPFRGHWRNTRRLRSSISYLTPVELDDLRYRPINPRPPPAGRTRPKLDPGRFRRQAMSVEVSLQRQCRRSRSCRASPDLGEGPDTARPCCRTRPSV
jgi:hypothetical protein